MKHENQLRQIMRGWDTYLVVYWKCHSMSSISAKYLCTFHFRNRLMCKGNVLSRRLLTSNVFTQPAFHFLSIYLSYVLEKWDLQHCRMLLGLREWIVPCWVIAASFVLSILAAAGLCFLASVHLSLPRLSVIHGIIMSVDCQEMAEEMVMLIHYILV